MPYETDAQHFDPATLHLLRHQGNRMHGALRGTVPPDRDLAKQIQVTVDDILDRRPRSHAVASDGEIIWSPTSWEASQAESVVVNATGQAEIVVAPIFEEEDLTAPGGGVGLLERPVTDDGLTRQQEDEARRWGRELGL